MALSIRTNVASLTAQRHLASNSSALEVSMARLSSGFRITRAGDDAAGLGISTKLESHIRSYNQAVRNANDGISVVQTAEAGLDQSASMLTRLRELAMQSASDGVGDSERAYVDQEAQRLLDELERVAQTTQFNGRKLLDGSAVTLDFHVGIDATSNDFISVTTLNATTAVVSGGAAAIPPSTAPGPLVADALTATANDQFQTTMSAGGNSTATAYSAAIGAGTAAGASNTLADYLAGAAAGIFDTGFRAAGGVPGNETITGSPNAAQQAGLDLLAATRTGGVGSGSGSAELATAYQTFATTLAATGGDVSAASAGIGLTAAGSAIYTAQQVFLANYTAAGGSLSGVNVALGSAATAAGLAALGYTVNPGTPATPGTGGLGVTGLSLASKGSALTALDTIDAALDRVSSSRATLGAAGNRLQAAIGTIQATSEALSAANSRIKDVDVAEETSLLARSSILQQAGVSVLAQANQAPQLALKLLG